LPLKTILKQIEEQHAVKFSYIDNEIEAFKIEAPPASYVLKQKLDYIKIKTGLNFKQTKNYIIVYTPVNTTTSLCGYIVDETEAPIEGVMVRYTTTNEFAITDQKGHFMLPRHDNQNIEFNHVAYETITLTVNSFKTDCRTITLNMQYTVLEEVVTERYLTPGISKKNDGSFLITPKKFGILPGLIEPDVLQTMQQLPGINSVDETVSNINVRGGTHDQNLFIWNGIRLFQTGHFFGLISALNPNLPHQIKIYKNGTSAFYGESVSSAIDISSRVKNIDETTFSVGANMINADFYTVLKTSENSGFELSARRSFTDIFDLPAYRQYSKRIFQNTVITGLNDSDDINYKSDKEFYYYDFTAQYHYKAGDNNDLFVDFIGMKNNLDFTQGTITSTRVVTKSSNISQLTLGGSATWKTQWNETNKGEVTIYGSYYNVQGKDEALRNSQILEQENKVFDTSIHLSNSTDMSNGMILHTGYQYDEIGITNSDKINTPDYSRNIKEVLRTHALIGEIEYNPYKSKIFSTIGIRGNYIENFSMFLFEPRLQFNYTLNDKWKIEVLGEFKSQSSSQIADVQQDFLGIEKRKWVLANEKDIPVQKSRQVSAGLYYRANKWQVSLENFYKKVNGITTPEQAFQNQLEFVNLTGNYRVYGAEFLVQKQFEGFYAWVSYCWNNNQYTFSDFEPSKFPSNFEITHTIKCAATYEWHNLKLALGSKWYTGRPETIPLSDEPVYNTMGQPEISYSDPNSDNIENFFQLDFSAMYGVKLKKDKVSLQFGVSVMNLLDRKNIINRYYRLNSDTHLIEVVNTYSVERVPNAMIRLSF
jgi:hypothetical protein